MTSTQAEIAKLKEKLDRFVTERQELKSWLTKEARKARREWDKMEGPEGDNFAGRERMANDVLKRLLKNEEG